MVSLKREIQITVYTNIHGQNGKFQKKEPKNYMRRMNNSENFATIYMGDKKFIWIEKSNNFGFVSV